MLNQSKSLLNITPLQIGALGSAFGAERPSHTASFISTSTNNLQEQINQNVIGLRANKNHASCYQQMKTQRNVLHEKPMIQNVGLTPNDLNLLMKGINQEMQRFIDTDLKFVLSEIQNNLQDQQQTFERQICNLVSKIQRQSNFGQVKCRKQDQLSNTKSLSPRKVEFSEDMALAQKKEFIALQDDFLRFSQQLEDNLNTQQSEIKSQFDIQQQINDQNQTAIESLLKEIDDLKTAQEKLAGFVDEQTQAISDGLELQEQKLLTHDQLFETMNIQIDKTKDDLEIKLKQLNNDNKNEQRGINNKMEKINEDLEAYIKQNESEKSKLISMIQVLEEKMSLDINSERLKQLEELLNNQDTVNALNQILQRIEAIEDQEKAQQDINGNFSNQLNQLSEIFTSQLSTQIDEVKKSHDEIQQEMEDELNSLQLKLKEFNEQINNIDKLNQSKFTDFEADQKRQDALIQICQEDIEQFNEKIQDTIDSIEQTNLNLENFKKDFAKDQARQDQEINLLKSGEAELSQKVEILQDSYQSQMDNYNSQLNKNIEDQTNISTAQFQNLQNKVEKLKSDLKLLSSQVNKNKEDTDVRFLQGDALQQKNGEENQEARREVERLQKELQSMKTEQENENQELNKAIQELQESNQQEMQQMIEQINEKIEENQAKNEGNFKSLSQIQTQNKNQTHNQDIQKQIDDINSKLAKLKELLQEEQNNNANSFNMVAEEIQKINLKDAEQDERLDTLEKELQDQQDLNEAKFNQVQQQLSNQQSQIEKIPVELEQGLDKKQREFYEAIIKDIEFLEDKFVNTLQKDTIQLIQKKDVSPLKNRVEVLEALVKNLQQKLEQLNQLPVEKQLKPEIVLNASPPKEDLTQKIHIQVQNIDENESTINLSKEEQMHQQLLAEMKRKRLWYLRKTPQDYIIEEIMLEKRCTQEKAEKIYLQTLEKNKMIRSSTASPAKRGNQNKEEGFLGIKSIFENIIHATSPRPQSRQGESPESKIHVQRFQPDSNEKVVQRNPMNRSFHIETDNQEVQKLLTPRKNSPSRAPYIVIKSPIHDETNVQTVSKQQSGRPQFLNINSQMNSVRTKQAIQNKSSIDEDDDMIDESNIDLDDLDDNNNNLISDNISNLNETQAKITLNDNQIWNKEMIAQTQSRQELSRFSQLSNLDKNVFSNQQLSQRQNQNPFQFGHSPSKSQAPVIQTGLKEMVDIHQNAPNRNQNKQYSMEEVKMQVPQQREMRNYQNKNLNQEEKDLDDLQQIDDEYEMIGGNSSHNQMNQINMSVYVGDKEFEGSQYYDHNEDILRPSILSQTGIQLSRPSQISQSDVGSKEFDISRIKVDGRAYNDEDQSFRQIRDMI